jgi:hypothetical protein
LLKRRTGGSPDDARFLVRYKGSVVTSKWTISSSVTKLVPEEASIVTSKNLILFFKGNLVFLRGTNGGTEKILLSGSFPDPNSMHTVPIHFFLFHGKPNHSL